MASVTPFLPAEVILDRLGWTPIGEALGQAANAAAGRAALELGTMATEAAASYAALATTNTFALAQTLTGGAITAKIYPPSNSANAFGLCRANGTTQDFYYDSTNGRFGFGGAPTTHTLEVLSSGVNILKVTRSNTLNAAIEFGNTVGTFYFGTAGTTADFGIGLSNNLALASFTITRANQFGFGPSNISPTHFVHLKNSTGTTNAIVNLLKIEATLTGAPSVGYGTGILVALKSSTTLDQDAGRLTWAWDVATHASRASKGQLTAYYTSTERPAITWGANSSVALLSFYDVATPIARQVLATGASATVDDVITALQALGLVKQS